MLDMIRGMCRKIVVVMVLVVIAVSADVVSACPTCKNSVAGYEHLVQGYFWSIVFMMSMPFILLTSFSAYFYYLVRKARLSNAGGLIAVPVAAEVTSAS